MEARTITAPDVITAFASNCRRELARRREALKNAKKIMIDDVETAIASGQKDEMGTTPCARAV